MDLLPNLSGMSRGAFPSPWYDYAGAEMPRNIRQALRLCEYIYATNGAYRQAQERIISYFITDIEIGSVDPRRQLGDDEKSKYLSFLRDVLDMPGVAQRVGADVACYGNAFVTLVTPFRRFLVCPRRGCSVRVPFKEFTTNPIFKYRFTRDLRFAGTCPACQYSGTWEIDDLPDDWERKLRVKLWSPHDIEILYDPFSDSISYLWNIPADYKERVRRGDLFVLEHAPKEVLDAIRLDAKFRFSDGVMFHAKERTLSGLPNRGWGIPRILAHFRSLFYLQVLRRYNEAIAMDYVVPFRLITPAPRGGAGAFNQGMELDPLLMLNAGDFRSQVEQMIRMRRRDPTRWNFLPFPVQYQILGGEARALAPRDLIDQGLDMMFIESGVPVEMQRATLTVQTAPVALRLFEATHHDVVRINNALLQFVVERSSALVGHDPYRAVFRRVTYSDDFQKTMAVLQLAMGGVISRTTALRMLGLEFADEARTIGEEAQYEQQTQQRLQDELAQQEFGEQIAAGMFPGSPAAPAGGRQAPATPPGGAAGNTSFITSSNVPMSLADVEAQAEALAQELLFNMPETQRISELRQLRQKNETLHAAVKSKMEEIRNRARSVGGAALLGQRPPARQG